MDKGVFFMSVMSDDAVISVVIPAYNRANIIKKCIDSVLMQTYRNIEIIVVDDCSEDNTADIVDGYIDERVRECIRLTKNRGACYARNFGASQAKGKYIAFQDSDDIWVPEKLEKQLQYLKNGNFDFVFCGMNRVSKGIKAYFPYWGFDENGDAQKQILQVNRCSTQCMLMTRELFERVKFDESIKRFQDWDFSIRVAEVGKIGYLAEALVYSEVQDNSITRKVSRYESLQVIYNKYEKIIRGDDLLMASFYRQFGGELWKVNKKRAGKCYKQSLKWEFSYKSLIKYIISCFSMDNGEQEEKKNDKVRVGILTYHRAKNYGAFLQAYGLCKRLNEENDISAEIIDFYMNKEVRRYRLNRNPIYILKNFGAWKFKKKLIKEFKSIYGTAPLSADACKSDDIEKFKKFIDGKYDVVIVGSDEVWKINSFRGFPNPYWLPGKMNCRKISYATSSRNDFSALDEKSKQLIKEYLSDFEYITVRDNKTYNQITSLFDGKINMDIMPDPSFIYDYPVSKERGRDILCQRVGINKEDKVIVVMTENKELRNAIAKEFGKDYKIVSVYEYSKSIINLPDLTPFEWLDVIACADIVLASYFHAICFSIIFGRQFLAFGTEIKKDKLEGVLSQLKLEDRYINISSELYKKGELQRLVDEKTKQPYDSSGDIEKLRECFNVFLEKIHG